jgi:phenylpropionate dioxygenase-like ring-hydroxylating dioxygenase large terminal subunit
MEKLTDRITLLAENASPDFAESLPPECYRSQAFFDIEVDTIFKAGWVSVGHISQIPNVGDYICCDLLGESLLITRAESMDVHVLSRICLHRWTPIVEGGGNTERFVCPFHAWTYALDGTLIGAPVTGTEPGFSVSQCRLPQFYHDLQDGFIMVNLSGNAEPFGSRIAPVHERFANYRLPDLDILGVLEYDCEYNWKILVETFMESYHHIGVHVDTLGKLYPARSTFAHPGSEAYALLENPARPGTEVGDDEPLPVMSGLSDEEHSRFFVYNVFPCHLVTLFPSFVGWFRVLPLGPARCSLSVFILVQPSVLESLSADVKTEILQWFDVINQEDITVNTSQQRGLQSRVAAAGRLNKLEAANTQFADFIRRSVSTNWQRLRRPHRFDI